MVSFTAPISGAQAAITRHDITAQNVANINTPGFEAYVPHQTDMMPEGTRIASVTRTPNYTPQTSNTDLVEETKEQIVNKGSLSANLKVLKTKDQMLGEVIDLIA
jgi:flagellar hook protein FlgE